VFEVLLLVVLAAGALAFGAVYAWAAWPLTVSSALLGLWALFQARAAPDPHVTPTPASRRLQIWLAVVGLAIACQAAPIPLGWLHTLSPATDRFLQQFALGYALQPPESHAISIAPVWTLTVLARFSGLALLLIGLIRAGTAVRFDRLAGGLVILGLGLAVFGVLQRAALSPGTAHRVYGVWESTFKGDPFGPFINRNHFAGWLVLSAGVGMGHALAVLDRARPPRAAGIADWLRWLPTPQASRFAFTTFATLAMGTAIIATRSRSGVGALLVTIAAFTLAASWRATGGVRRALIVTYGAALAIVALLWAGVSATLMRFATASVDLASRWSAWEDTTRIIRDFPWFGTGLGTFDLAMLVYQTGYRDTMFAQAHNDYLQLAAEGGVLVGVPAVLTLVVLTGLIRQRLRTGQADVAGQWRRLGAAAGLLGIAAQSLVEFSLQMPAVATLCVVVLGLAASPPGRRSSHARRV
jgi:O-antigen ligase